MCSIVKHLQSLYEQELYSNVTKVCELVWTACEQRPDYLILGAKFQVILYYADSLFKTQQYLQAENLYRQAVQMRKNLIKNKNANNKINDAQIDLASDVEIKYKIHLCCLALKQKNAAVDILQVISARLRTPKINMALGTLYKEAGMERSAITCFKEVLRECPLALEAVENLLQLGVKGVEVNSLMVEVTSDISWLNNWLKAQAQLHSRDFASALNSYKTMDSSGLLRENPSLLVNMAHCYHYLCEDDKAILVLQRAIQLCPNMTFGRDFLSTLLVKSGTKEHIRYLEGLTPTVDMSLWTSENWVVLGNYMYAMKKYEKAAYFGQQACLLNRRNIEAFLLKANTLLQIKKYQDAASHCTEALQICPYRFDLYKCLVECYIQTNRLREAESHAINACKQLNHSAQAYTLHATVLLKDPMPSSKNVRRTLEKAIAQDKNCSTNALCMLVEFLEQDQQFEQASQILLKHIETLPSSRAHQLLGDCFFNMQRDEEAFHHYTIALKLDFTNQRATEGLSCIGRSLSLSKRDSYYTCVGETSYTSQGTTASDHEADPESDTDPWPTGADMGLE